MQIPLAFIDSVVIEEVSLPLWRELFDEVGWPAPLAGKGDALTHDDVVIALQHDTLSDDLLQALETLHDLGTPAGRENQCPLGRPPDSFRDAAPCYRRARA